MADAVQTTWGSPIVTGLLGEPSDAQTVRQGKEESMLGSGAIAFGRAVCSAASAPNTVYLPTNATDAGRVRGIAMADRTKASGAGYATLDQIRVLKSGRINVYFENSIADLAVPYVRHTESTTGAADQGQFRSDSDAGKASAMTNARCIARNGVTTTGIGVIEIDFQGHIG
jgi:hypothetical protein